MKMLEHGQFWRNKALREHVAVVDDKLAPTIVLENCTYLNVFTKKWLKANIWIYRDRIVYVWERMPANTNRTEIMECTGQYVVPDYIKSLLQKNGCKGVFEFIVIVLFMLGSGCPPIQMERKLWNALGNMWCLVILNLMHTLYSCITQKCLHVMQLRMELRP